MFEHFQATREPSMRSIIHVSQHRLNSSPGRAQTLRTSGLNNKRNSSDDSPDALESEINMGKQKHRGTSSGVEVIALRSNHLTLRPT